MCYQPEHRLGIRVQTKQCLMEMEFSQAVSAEHLNESLNELILWHGTKKETAGDLRPLINSGSLKKLANDQI